jgi:uncharacterized protein YneF (UPF0154 family)
MYYLGFLKDDTKNVVVFRSTIRPKKKEHSYFVRVMGPYQSEANARRGLRTLKEAYGEFGYQENPATSERQRRFMCAELGRLRAGKKTRTSMSDRQLRDFCIKKNPFIAESQIRIGTTHELEHTTDRMIARKIACDHLKEDPRYYRHLASMEKRVRETGHNVMSRAKALALTKKVLVFGKDVYNIYRKKNPGQEYHDQKFITYMKDLEKYIVGSAPYIATLAKAYEHLQSAKDSIRECVR